MTRNPYADQSTFEAVPPPSRVSGLAVSSLVFGLLCCIPFVGIIAMILGGAGMIAISRSDGRLSGRGLATAGLVLGLLGTIWTGIIGFGTLQGVAQVQSLTGTYEYAEKKDYAGFENLFTPAAQQQLTDASIDEFVAKVNGAWGKHQGPTKGLGQIISGYSELGPMFQKSPQSAAGDVIPVPLKFEKGTALGWFQINPRQMNTRNMPALENIVVLDPNGTPIWLLPKGSAGTPGGPTGTPPPPPPPPPPSPTSSPENPPKTGEAPPPTGP